MKRKKKSSPLPVSMHLAFWGFVIFMSLRVAMG